VNFSFSAISAFKSCPKSFEFKYLKQLPEAFVSIERQVGTCIHETLRWAYEKRKSGEAPDLNMAKIQFEKEWNRGDFEKLKIIKLGSSLQDYFNSAQELLVSFFRKVFPLDRSETIELEYKFNIELAKDIQYRGIIDRIARQPEGMIRVTDFKTGRVDHPLENLQLPSYALHVFDIFDDQDIELCYEDLNTGRTIVAPFTRKNVPEVKKDLLAGIETIRGTGLFPAKPTVLCQWCGYNQICENPHESVKSMVLDGGVMNNNPDLQEKKGDQHFCPECGSPLKKRKGKFGSFLGCTNFPECRYTLNLRDSGNKAASGTGEEEICPECGGVLRERKGKFGPFLGCSRYPDCRFTRKIKKD
jgi:ribosomal protein L37AE/L43A